jgi:MerR family transcriptional regulator, light-induced transcriptional regulator
METLNTPQYNIGVVVRRTNIHPETLRVWERRYELIVPDRSETGRRLYSEGDIRKLQLVKQLTELGHGVSSLAKLSSDELLERLTASHHQGAQRETRSGLKCRVAFVGDALRVRYGRHLLYYKDIDIVGSMIPGSSASHAQADVVIIDLSTINEESHALIEQYCTDSGASAAVVVFNFATRKAISELESAGIVCLKGALSAAEIYRACMSFMQPLFNAASLTDQQTDEESTPPRFDKDQLSHIATLSSAIACECPNHLAELIINLTAFEHYSLECANRNEDDARLHLQLNQSTAAARMILEESLARLIEIEGIVV